VTPERRETWQCERCAAVRVTRTPLVLRGGFWVGDGGVAPGCEGCGRGMERAPFAPLLGRQVSPLLEELWTPVMAELGLVWREDQGWVEEGDLMMRRMVRFAPLKGAGARARFGYSLAFAPAAERNTLAYHRTWRSAELDVFEWSGDVDLVNPLVARSTLAAAARPLAEAAGHWFAAVPDLEVLERLLVERVERDLCRDMFPGPEYVLSFFAAARGRMAEARQLMGDSLPEELREKALGRSGLRLG
jgi:hypothetical protein